MAQIFMDKLDADEKRILFHVNEMFTVLDNINFDAFNSCANKDCGPFLKRLQEQRDRAKKSRDDFINYLVITGKAMND